MGDKDALCRSFDQHSSVGEEQVAVGDFQVACHEAFGFQLAPESLADVHHAGCGD